MESIYARTALAQTLLGIATSYERDAADLRKLADNMLTFNGNRAVEGRRSLSPRRLRRRTPGSSDRPRRRLSTAGRANIAKAQKLRWNKLRAGKS